MKFLLVALNSKYIHSNPAIYSLRAYAGAEYREHIEIAEYTINNQLQEIMADIYLRKPDVIGFSCYIWNWSMIQELLMEVHKLLPDVPIWLGGPEVSFDASEILQKYPQVKGIMLGEGEATFKELVGFYLGNAKLCEANREADVDGTADKVSDEMAKTLADIAGLCLPSGYTQPRELTNISELPFLYDDLEPFANKIIYYESSRGCPYRCSYCLSSIDKTVRLRDINVVKRELQFFLDHKVKQVKFVDRTFNCNHEHAMEIWRYIHEYDNGVTNFHFEVSADILKEDQIQLLNQMRPGLAQLEIGVQSTNPDTLRAIDRVMNVERLEGIVDSINRGQNVHQHLDLIAGLPYEDYESFAESFNRVYAMKPEQLQLGFLKVLKGSKMHDCAGEYEICYMSKPPYEVLYTKWLSFDDVLRLKRIEEMVELYYNSNQYTHTIPFLVRAFETPFAMYEAMADFYEEKGFFVNSPARAYRYNVLLEFAKEYDSEHEAVYKELLTYDMYLRENLKSRPDFATDITSFKEQVRDFYQKEAQERILLPDYQQYDWKQLSKMTHLEPFYYSVWDVELLTEAHAAKEPSYVLFDYQNRNALTYEANVKVLMA